MAHFYVSCRGGGNAVHRLGGAAGGVTATAASYNGSISIRCWQKDGTDWARVAMGKWEGTGTDRVLYDGPINATGTAATFAKKPKSPKR